MSATQTTRQTDLSERRSWLAPLLAIGFAVMFVAAFAGSDSGADPETSGADIIAKHAQSSTSAFLTGTALIIAAIVLVFFGGWLRQTLRSKTARPDWLPDVALAGIVVQAFTFTIFVSVWFLSPGLMRSGE